MRKKHSDEEKIEGGLWVKDGFARGPESASPVVSIITVCLNSEKHIEQTIESVLGQTYGHIEYIIIDGGSTDGTLDILREYDDRISYWVSEPDEGLYDAMNKGVSLATGELVGIVNSDDWYFPYSVEEAVRASVEDPDVQVFFGDVHIVDLDGALLGVLTSTEEDIEHVYQVHHPTCFVRRAVYEDYKYRTRFRIAADYDLMLRLHQAGVRFHRIDLPITYCRIGGVSTAYYRRIADIYDVKWDNGLLSPWQYVSKRLALVFRAPVVRFRKAVAGTFFKEIEETRRALGDTTAYNIALQEELEAASRHIAKVEGELALRGEAIAAASRHLAEVEREIARRDEEIARLSLALEEARAGKPTGGGLRRIMNRLSSP